MMTKFIKENCFELTFEGMDLKFTSLQERNIYNESQIRVWCRDGDLETFVTGEFDIITIMGNRTQVLDLVQLIDVAVNELIVLIRETGKIYHQDNYVANILFSSDIVQTEIFNGTLFNISGEVTICSNRSTINEENC